MSPRARFEQGFDEPHCFAGVESKPLKGVLGDALHAVLCSARHNMYLALSVCKLFVAHVRYVVLAWLGAQPQPVTTEFKI